MTTTENSNRQAIEFAKVTAQILNGENVKVSCRNGQTFEGQLWHVGNASCKVGLLGHVAYGGIANIEPL